MLQNIVELLNHLGGPPAHAKPWVHSKLKNFHIVKPLRDSGFLKTAGIPGFEIWSYMYTVSRKKSLRFFQHTFLKP